MVDLKDIVKALEASWNYDTTFDASEWTPENPSRGQCVVSSLVVQDYLGGELLRYTVDENNLHETHYLNQLDDGTIIDTTGKQYDEPVNLRMKPVNIEGFDSIRNKRLNDKITNNHYILLKNRVVSYLENLNKIASS